MLNLKYFENFKYVPFTKMASKTELFTKITNNTVKNINLD